MVNRISLFVKTLLENRSRDVTEINSPSAKRLKSPSLHRCSCANCRAIDRLPTLLADHALQRYVKQHRGSPPSRPLRTPGSGHVRRHKLGTRCRSLVVEGAFVRKSDYYLDED